MASAIDVTQNPYGLNRELIESAPDGSDIHGVLERIAEALHEEHPTKRDTDNWSKAVDILHIAGTKIYSLWLREGLVKDINLFGQGIVAHRLITIYYT